MPESLSSYSYSDSLLATPYQSSSSESSRGSTTINPGVYEASTTSYRTSYTYTISQTTDNSNQYVYAPYIPITYTTIWDRHIGENRILTIFSPTFEELGRFHFADGKIDLEIEPGVSLAELVCQFYDNHLKHPLTEYHSDRSTSYELSFCFGSGDTIEEMKFNWSNRLKVYGTYSTSAAEFMGALKRFVNQQIESLRSSNISLEDEFFSRSDQDTQS